MNRNVMIDIESLSTYPGGLVVAIGACTFDMNGVHEKMYSAIDVLESLFEGFTINLDTVAWWKNQSPEAKNFIRNGHPPGVVYQQLANFIRKNDQVWAKGPDFDLDLLKAGYDTLGIKVPWSFRNARCVRTVLDLGKRMGFTNFANEQTKHFALGDAIYQAEQVIHVYRKLTEQATVPGGPSPCLL